MSLIVRNDSNTWCVQVDPTDSLWADFLPPPELLGEELVIPGELGATFEREWVHIEKLANSQPVRWSSVRDLSSILNLPEAWTSHICCDSDDVYVRMNYYRLQGIQVGRHNASSQLIEQLDCSILREVMNSLHPVCPQMMGGILLNRKLGGGEYTWGDIAHIIASETASVPPSVRDTISIMNRGHTRDELLHIPYTLSETILTQYRLGIVVTSEILAQLGMPSKSRLLSIFNFAMSGPGTACQPPSTPIRARLADLIPNVLTICTQLPNLASGPRDVAIYESNIGIGADALRSRCVPHRQVIQAHYERIVAHILEAFGRDFVFQLLVELQDMIDFVSPHYCKAYHHLCSRLERVIV